MVIFLPFVEMSPLDYFSCLYSVFMYKGMHALYNNGKLVHKILSEIIKRLLLVKHASYSLNRRTRFDYRSKILQVQNCIILDQLLFLLPQYLWLSS